MTKQRTVRRIDERRTLQQRPTSGSATTPIIGGISGGGGSLTPTTLSDPVDLVLTGSGISVLDGLQYAYLDIAWQRGGATAPPAYLVSYSDDDFATEMLHSVAGAITTTRLDLLQPDTAYKVRVRAQSGTAQSAYTPNLSATTPSTATPSAPSGVVVVGGIDTITVVWDQPPATVRLTRVVVTQSATPISDEMYDGSAALIEVGLGALLYDVSVTHIDYYGVESSATVASGSTIAAPFVDGMGTAGHAAYWLDANTIAAEAQLALSRGGTGANLSATGPGVVQQSTIGGALSVASTPGGQILFGAAGGAGVATDANAQYNGESLIVNAVTEAIAAIIGNANIHEGIGILGLATAANAIGLYAIGDGVDARALVVNGIDGAIAADIVGQVNILGNVDIDGVLSLTTALSVANGGTGATTLTSNGVLLGNGTSPVSATAAGTANQVLRVPSGGGSPAFGAIDLSSSAAVMGELAKANQNAQTAYLDAANTFLDAQKVERLGASSTTFALLELYANTTVTPTNALGTQITLGAESSTTNSQGQAAIRSGWLDVTHATRRGFLSLRATDTATREGMVIGTNGSAATIGFYGVAGIARRTTAAAATDLASVITLANDIRTGLINLGLLA